MTVVDFKYASNMLQVCFKYASVGGLGVQSAGGHAGGGPGSGPVATTQVNLKQNHLVWYYYR